MHIAGWLRMWCDSIKVQHACRSTSLAFRGFTNMIWINIPFCLHKGNVWNGPCTCTCALSCIQIWKLLSRTVVNSRYKKFMPMRRLVCNHISLFLVSRLEPIDNFFTRCIARHARVRRASSSKFLPCALLEQKDTVVSINVARIKAHTTRPKGGMGVFN